MLIQGKEPQFVAGTCWYIKAETDPLTKKITGAKSCEMSGFQIESDPVVMMRHQWLSPCTAWEVYIHQRLYYSRPTKKKAGLECFYKYKYIYIQTLHENKFLLHSLPYLKLVMIPGETEPDCFFWDPFFLGTVQPLSWLGAQASRPLQHLLTSQAAWTLTSSPKKHIPTNILFGDHNKNHHRYLGMVCVHIIFLRSLQQTFFVSPPNKLRSQFGKAGAAVDGPEFLQPRW